MSRPCRRTAGPDSRPTTLRRWAPLAQSGWAPALPARGIHFTGSVPAKKTFRTDPVPAWIDEDRRYRLIRRLIEDPLGQLWRGQDMLLQAAVTIRLVRGPEGLDRLELMEHRLDLAANELRHPNVATVLDHGIGEPVPVRFVVIERLRA